MKIIALTISFFTYLLQGINADDYKFFPEVGKVYKVHSNLQIWDEALWICFNEGASLAYPTTELEAKVINSLYKEKFPSAKKEYYSIGFSDKIVASDYLLLNGQSIYKYYHEFSSKCPIPTPFRCGGMNSEDAKLVEMECYSTKYNFVCEKDRRLINDYNCNDKMEFCYKVHMDKKLWGDAEFECLSEGGHLAIINSLQIENHLAALVCDIDIPSYDPDWNYKVLVGFHQMFAPGIWYSVVGLELDEYGYANWERGYQPLAEPNKCGAMLESGPLSDHSCNVPNYYVCQRPNPKKKKCGPCA